MWSMSTGSIKKKGTFSGDDMQEKEMDPMGVTRIVKISIYYYNYGWIEGFTVYVERNGTTQCANHWGGTGGKVTEVNLATNEYITSVNGHVTHNSDGICYVTSLVLKTSLNVYGPFSREFGESFEFSAPLGGEIIGFHGYCREEYQVNALGVYVRQTNGSIIKKGPFLGDGAIVKHIYPIITRIVKINIYHSDKIDALTVYFERNGIAQFTDRWGGDGGKLTEINLKTNEYIKSVKGKYHRDSNLESSHILKSLVLETNLAIYGPYGKEEGESFKHTSPPDGQIIGFFALVNVNYILRVGVHVQAFISESVAWGGSGGLPRKMHKKSAVSRIVKVSIRHGDTIDALSVCYKLQDGTTESTPLWGGETGRLTEINLQYNEDIKAVRGYVGYFGDLFIVRSLQLITHRTIFEYGKKTYGPYGKEEGTPFELSAFDGKIVGFHGRSGAYLDAIGVYVQWPEEED